MATPRNIEVFLSNCGQRIQFEAPGALTGRAVVEKALKIAGASGSADDYDLLASDGRIIAPKQHLESADFGPGSPLLLRGRVGCAGGVELPPSAPASAWRAAVRHQFIFSMTGLLSGLGIMGLGATFCYLGVEGKTTWSAHLLGFDSRLVDAAPGVVLIVVGLILIWVTQHRVSVARPDGMKRRSSR